MNERTITIIKMSVFFSAILLALIGAILMWLFFASSSNAYYWGLGMLCVGVVIIFIYYVNWSDNR